MTDERLEELLSAFASRRIAVWGDYFLDKYFEVDPSLAEPSLETGKTAHQVVSVRYSPGAAGTVVNNLVALGAGQVHVFGLTGDDGSGYELRRALQQRGCHIDGLLHDIERYTPMYLKPTDAGVPGLAGEHSRYDTQNRTPTSTTLDAAVWGALERSIEDVDAVIAMDQVDRQDHGVITAASRRRLARLATVRPDKVFWADSRAFISEFRGVIVKANQFEAVGKRNPSPDETIALDQLFLAATAMRRGNSAPVCITRGPGGVVVSDPEPALIPAVQLTGPVDPTGAGDSVTAAAVLALSSGASLAEAALLGILTASITIQVLGSTGVASPDALRERLRLWRSQQQ